MNHDHSQDFGLHFVEVLILLTASLHTRSRLRSDLLCEDDNITTADFKANRQVTILSTRSRLRSDLLREDVTTSVTDYSIVLTWLQRPLTNGRHLEATASTLFNKKHL